MVTLRLNIDCLGTELGETQNQQRQAVSRIVAEVAHTLGGGPGFDGAGLKTPHGVPCGHWSFKSDTEWT